MAPLTKLTKPSRTARKIREKREKRTRSKTLVDNKRAAKARDRFCCRFPWCGCRPLGLSLESAHIQAAGMGGDKAGKRAGTDNLITLCTHRHQFGDVSLHKGTLRVFYQSPWGCDGLVQWCVDAVTAREITAFEKPDLIKFPDGRLFEVLATERAIGVFDVLTDRQMRILETLGQMAW